MPEPLSETFASVLPLRASTYKDEPCPESVPSEVQGTNLTISLTDRDIFGNLLYTKNVEITVGDRTIAFSPSSTREVARRLIHWADKAELRG